MTTAENLGNFVGSDAPSYEDVLQCMRCGFCLPTCPTFALTRPGTVQPTRPGGPGPGCRRGAPAFQPGDEGGSIFLPGLPCLHDSLSVRRQGRRGHGSLPRPGAAAAAATEMADNFTQIHPAEDAAGSGPARKFSMLPARLYQKLGIQWLVRNSRVLKLGPQWVDKAEGMMPQLNKPAAPTAARN